MEEKQILVSLGDARIKDISEVLGNKTCNKILDYLAEKEGTVTEIATALNMPINTTDYNTKKLIKAGLIEKANHWWSVKGKKIPSYKVSNKKIIITPKTYSPKNLLLTLGITGLAALSIRNFWPTNLPLPTVADSFVVEPATSMMMKALPEATVVTQQATSTLNLSISISPWSWFLLGAWLAIALYVLLTTITERRKKIHG